MAASSRGMRGAALLLEDELLVGIHVEELLEDAGYEAVLMAARVEEALILLRNRRDIVAAVLDVNLAGEQSWPVARECRGRGIPYVFVTGYLKDHAALPDDLADSILLSKPVDEEVLGDGLARAAAAAAP